MIPRSPRNDTGIDLRDLLTDGPFKLVLNNLATQIGVRPLFDTSQDFGGGSEVSSSGTGERSCRVVRR